MSNKSDRNKNSQLGANAAQDRARQDQMFNLAQTQNAANDAAYAPVFQRALDQQSQDRSASLDFMKQLSQDSPLEASYNQELMNWQNMNSPAASQGQAQAPAQSAMPAGSSNAIAASSSAPAATSAVKDYASAAPLAFNNWQTAQTRRQTEGSKTGGRVFGSQFAPAGLSAAIQGDNDRYNDEANAGTYANAIFSRDAQNRAAIPQAIAARNAKIGSLFNTTAGLQASGLGQVYGTTAQQRFAGTQNLLNNATGSAANSTGMWANFRPQPSFLGQAALAGIGAAGNIFKASMGGGAGGAS